MAERATEPLSVENDGSSVSFASDPGDPGPLVRLLESARPGSYVQIGKRVEQGATILTALRQIPGRGAVHATPLALVDQVGRPIDMAVGVALVLAELEARERIAAERFILVQRAE